MQRHLLALGRARATSVATNSRIRSSSLLRHTLHARAFQSLGLGRDLVQRLAELGVTVPTPAQRQAIPAVLRRRDVVIAAETGGGKTLAYLLPLLEQLRAHPLALQETHRPVALVLAPSQELVRQVAAVLAALQPELARHAAVLSSANQALSRRRASPLVLATPRALLRACKPKDFAFTRTIVVDEADMLLGGGFEKDTKQILATIRNQPLLLAHLNDCERARVQRGGAARGDELGGRDAAAAAAAEDDDEEENDEEEEEAIDRDEVSTEQRQTIFSAISFSMRAYYGKRSVREYISYKFPDAVFAVTEDFQRTLPRLDMRFHELEKEKEEAAAANSSDTDDVGSTLDDGARKTLLWKILTDAQQQPTNTLVFANSIASADSLFDFLEAQVQRQRVAGAETASGPAFPARVLLFHKEVDRQQRQDVLAQLDDESANVVVVCTDIAARGLDTTKVRHVVQYEFANDVVSHLHRIGRTGRAGTAGRVTNIVSSENALVLEKIRAAGASSLNGAFSRKRSLRKKAKKLSRDR